MRLYDILTVPLQKGKWGKIALASVLNMTINDQMVLLQA